MTNLTSVALVAANVASALTCRAAPMFVWGTVASAAPRRVRLGMAVLAAAAIAFVARMTGWRVSWVIGAYAWFCVLGFGAMALSVWLRRGFATPGGVFAWAASCFVVVPG